MIGRFFLTFFYITMIKTAGEPDNVKTKLFIKIGKWGDSFSMAYDWPFFKNL